MTTLSEWFRDIITWGLGILSGLMGVVMLLFVYIFQSVLKSIDARFAQRLMIEEELKQCIKELKKENNERFDSTDEKMEVIDRSLHRLHGRLDADTDKIAVARHIARPAPRLPPQEDITKSDRPSEES